jgi:hypothetical protein
MMVAAGFLPTDDEIPYEWVARYDAWIDAGPTIIVAHNMRDDERVRVFWMTQHGAIRMELEFPTTPLGARTMAAAVNA